MIYFLEHQVPIALGIVGCVFILLFVLYACAAGRNANTDAEDEEQMRYLAEWKKRKEGTKK